MHKHQQSGAAQGASGADTGAGPRRRRPARPADFRWRIAVTDNVMRARPQGVIDTANCERFQDLLLEAVRTAVAGKFALVVDLSGVDTLPAAALRALELARRAAAARIEVALASPNPRLREILAVSKIDGLFRIVDLPGAEEARG